MTSGWFAVYRKFFDPMHDMADADPACKRFAFLDLIGMARWKDGGGLKKGQLRHAQKFLATRWGWSRKKVSRFLEELEADGRIQRVHQAGRKRDIISICNYDSYQKARPVSVPPNDTPSDPPSDPQEEQEQLQEEYSPSSAREESNLERLVAFVGEELRPQIEVVAGMVDNPNIWALGLMGLYGPHGTEARLMAGVEEDERPEVLGTALVRYATDAKDWDGKYFRGFVRKAVGERKRDKQPVARSRDFGDETERDVSRRSEYRKRESKRKRERWDEEDKESERKMKELWRWWENLDDTTRKRIELEAKRKAGGMPPNAQRPILIGVMFEHYEEAMRESDAA